MRLHLFAIISVVTVALVSCGGGSSFTPTISLLRADGQTIETTATPVPLGVSVRFAFTNAVSNASDRTSVEEQIRLLAPGDVVVAGVFSWNAEFTLLTFNPTGRLAYQTTYTISTGSATADVSASVGKASVPASTTTFTTMLMSDFNGDGYADLAMASPGKEIGGNVRSGQVYLFDGTADGVATTPTATFNGTGEYEDSFGNAHVAADLNGDGYDDLIIGAPGRDSFRGYIEVHNGSADGLSATPDSTLTGAQADATFGSFVANVGDVNGDGIDDLAISSVRYETGGLVNAGAIFVHYGSADGITDAPDVSIMGGNANDDFGTWVTAGDFNGDGYDDLVGSATGYDGNKGLANVYPGSADGLVTDAASVTTISGENADDLLGYGMSSSDFNGDGYPDLSIGAPGWATGVGSVYVFDGSADGIVTAAFDRLVGNSQPDLFGFGASAGDMNGDGFGDLVVGAPYAVANARDGVTYIHRGSASGIEQSQSVTWNGSGAEWFGFVYPSLDLNGDGNLDAIVAGPHYDAERGRVYIYYGDGSGFSNPVLLEGEAAGDRFGDYTPLS